MRSLNVKRLRAIVAGSLLSVSDVASATLVYTVNSTADLVDADLSDGVCVTSAGTCTLRAAVMQSNVVPSAAPVIVLPAGTFRLGCDGVVVGTSPHSCKGVNPL